MINNIFNIINNIYKKEAMVLEMKPDLGLCIALTYFLRYDIDNLPILKKLVDIMYYVEPKHYLMLLFICIPRKWKAPFLKKVTLQKNELSTLLGKIQKTLKWSNREIQIHQPLLEKIIDKEYWRKELGVK